MIHAIAMIVIAMGAIVVAQLVYLAIYKPWEFCSVMVMQCIIYYFAWDWIWGL